MSVKFPQFCADPRADTKRYSAWLLFVAVIVFALLVAELTLYSLIKNEQEIIQLKIERYEALRNALPDGAVLQSQYADLKKKTNLLDAASGDNKTLGFVLSVIEKNLDEGSVVDKVLYDAGKKHSLIYLKSIRPKAFEASITSERLRQELDFTILSKNTAKQEPFKILYELRAAL